MWILYYLWHTSSTYLFHGICFEHTFFFFFLENILLVPPPPFSFLFPECWLNSFYSCSQLAIWGISLSSFQGNTLLPSHEHCAELLWLLNLMLAGDGGDFFASSRGWHKTICSSWSSLNLWSWIAIVQLCMRRKFGSHSAVMEGMVNVEPTRRFEG